MMYYEIASCVFKIYIYTYSKKYETHDGLYYTSYYIKSV